MRWQGQILLIFSIILAVVFMPTSIMLFFAMIPTFVAVLVDKGGKGTKALTVGAMNLAGCSPFMVELWSRDHTVDVALKIIFTPRTIVVIYSAAAIGYLINWAMAGIVQTIMVQKSNQRLKDIKKRQGELIQRWGREVTGDIPLNELGFPVNPDLAGKDEDAAAAGQTAEQPAAQTGTDKTAGDSQDKAADKTSETAAK